MKERRRFLCFGLGAIGTYIGGSLEDAGDEVVFIERSESIPEIQKDGLFLITPFKEIKIQKVNVVSTVEEALSIGQYDACILAVKSFDTANLLESVRSYKEQFPPVLCLQNGVENEGLIENVLGKEKVIAGSVTTAVSRHKVGQAIVEKFRGVGIENNLPISRILIEHFNQAGLHSIPYQNRSDLKWSKMLTNLQANASAAILNWTPSQVFSNPVSYHIEVEAMKEAVKVMRSIGAKVVNLPRTPVSSWVNAMVSWPEWMSRPLISQFLGKGRGAKMPSFHIDLYAGRKQSEVVFLNGAVVRVGEQNQLRTPFNKALTEILISLAQGNSDKAAFDGKPEILLQRIEETI